MIGEIRDEGDSRHGDPGVVDGALVFSTLHTNDSAGATTRMLDMGVEPFLVASSVEGILAQRLVRKICSECSRSYDPAEPDEDVAKLKDFIEPMPSGLGLKQGEKLAIGAGAGRAGILGIAGVLACMNCSR